MEIVIKDLEAAKAEKEAELRKSKYSSGSNDQAQQLLVHSYL